MPRKPKRLLAAEGGKIRLRPGTRDKYQQAKQITGASYPELADRAIDALLEKGIAFLKQGRSHRGPESAPLQA